MNPEEPVEDNKVLLHPDYDEEDLNDDDDEIEFDDLEDEGTNETILDSYLKENNKKEKEKEKNEEIPKMTPFSPTPNWINNNSENKSGSFQYAYSQPQQKPMTAPSWGSGFSQPSGIWGNNNRSNFQPTQQIEIDREKEIIVCDFLDVIAQTGESDGKPGLLPRDIYDLVPRLNVWSMIKAFNPRYVYGLFPRNLIPNTNGAEGWKATINYFCCGLSCFLRLPYAHCQMLVQSKIGQPKEDLIKRAIYNLNLDKKKMLYIGIYSGLYYGQSNEDALAAERCGIDYMDLNQLLK